MAEMNEEHWQADVQGRLVAIETILQGLLAFHIGAVSDPEEHLAKIRRSFFATLQNIDRPIGEEYDLVWEYATKALNNHFDNVAVKIANVERRKRANDKE